MVREWALMGVSLMLFSNGVSMFRPIASSARKANAMMVQTTRFQIPSPWISPNGRSRQNAWTKRRGK